MRDATEVKDILEEVRFRWHNPSSQYKFEKNVSFYMSLMWQGLEQKDINVGVKYFHGTKSYFIAVLKWHSNLINEKTLVTTLC